MGMSCVLGNRFEGRWDKDFYFGTVPLHHSNESRISHNRKLLFVSEKMIAFSYKKGRTVCLPMISIILNC